MSSRPVEFVDDPEMISWCPLAAVILGGFANSGAERRARCDPVPAAYRRDCYRGARAG